MRALSIAHHTPTIKGPARPQAPPGQYPLGSLHCTGYASIDIVNETQINLTILVHFTPGATPNEKSAFVSGAERRLSGQVGRLDVHTTIVPVDSSGGYGGKGVINVTIEGKATSNNNPHAGGGVGNSVYVSSDLSGMLNSRDYPDATAGSDAHELFHNLLNFNLAWPGQHNPNNPDLMGTEGGWASGAGLSESDIESAENCSCNAVSRIKRTPPR